MATAVDRISAVPLGSLVNTVEHCHGCEPWTFGLRALMANLADRKLL